MPGSLIVQSVTIVAFGLAVGAGGAALMKHAPVADRTIASIPTEDRDSRAGMPEMRAPLGKHLSIVHVSLQAPAGIPDSEEGEVELVGQVRLNRPVDNDVNFKWELPEGVQVISGDVENRWSGLQVGEVAEARMRVKGFSREELRLVALHGFVKAGGGQFGNSAVLTSRPEDSLELIQPDIASGIQAQTTKPTLKGKILR